VLCLNKPGGVTSRDVVNQVTAALGRGVKAGHAGTLDPLASGVLVVCLGAATRLIEYVQAQAKVYRTVVRLGARSDTLDADGNVVETEGAVPPAESAVRAAAAGQVGTLLQKPPEFSALKVGGRRAYDLARAGQAVELAARPVTVYRVDVLNYEWPRLELEVECGSGTYIRSMARDIGDALGCGGLVEVLVRTRVGAFRLEDAGDPGALTAATLPSLLRPAAEAVAGMPVVGLTAEQVADVSQGRSVVAAGELPLGEVALIGPDGSLAAVGQAEPASGRVAPRRVLVGAG
jgi:tRNA pseudouridine55 synthase